MFPRPFTCCCAALAIASGFFLYTKKHQTTVLDQQISGIVQETEHVRAQTSMLRTEWALENQPERLAQLVTRHTTNLHAMDPAQFVRMADLVQHLPAVTKGTPTETAAPAVALVAAAETRVTQAPPVRDRADMASQTVTAPALVAATHRVAEPHEHAPVLVADNSALPAHAMAHAQLPAPMAAASVAANAAPPVAARQATSLPVPAAVSVAAARPAPAAIAVAMSEGAATPRAPQARRQIAERTHAQSDSRLDSMLAELNAPEPTAQHRKAAVTAVASTTRGTTAASVTPGSTPYRVAQAADAPAAIRHPLPASVASWHPARTARTTIASGYMEARATSGYTGGSLLGRGGDSLPPPVPVTN
ncbi:MAG: hypothetical protein ABF791_11485 [Acetobacter sp.]|uniref:cell division protein FtsL n=1 Tax=Acetobacter sp. TaxID=440 RepID=UPI0039EB0861